MKTLVSFLERPSGALARMIAAIAIASLLLLGAALMARPAPAQSTAVGLALTATTSGSAFGANYGGWAVKAPGQTYGNSLVVPAASKQRHMSGQKFKRGNRHTFRRGHRSRRGHRFRHRRHSFAFVFPYYYPYYGYRRYRRYDYPYAPPPAYAQTAPSYAQPAEPAPAPTPEQESYCREIIMDVVIDGVEQQAYGTACREPDGSWKIKN